ncbi:MAG: hypothetical protein OXF63_02845 [Anaerolineaceae bacterium]|nr:hypothetical protein [Anaerolineaceae bacterium]
MRRPLLYLALLAALAALTETSRLAANLQFVADGAAGALLYAADFGSPDDSMGLSAGDGSARLQDGELRLEPGEPNRLVYSVAGPELADFELEVETRAQAGPLDNGFGVLFRLQQPRSFPLAEAFGPPATGGAAGISYYLFLASSDGYYQLLRTLSGRQQVLSTWIPSPFIRQGIGVSNRLKIRASGPELEFFINDRQLEFCKPDSPSDSSTWVAGDCLGGQMRSTVRDGVLLRGRIALAAQSMHEAGVLLAFDNLLLRMPAEGAVGA